MAVSKDKKRLLVTIPKDTWERVRHYRFSREIESYSEALLKLIERALDADEKGRRK